MFNYRTPGEGEAPTALQDALLQVMGPVPGTTRRVEPAVEVESEEVTPLFTRRLISFATEPNDRIGAYLLLPHAPLQRRGTTPAVLCLHQTTRFMKAEPAGVGGLSNLHYAAELAERGYITLAPDYHLGPHFAKLYATQFDPYAHGYASATMKGIWNHSAALDLLQNTPGVDGERLAVIGHSLGGQNALFLAAFDERPRVIVSSCGYSSFGHSRGGDVSDWSHGGYMPRIATHYGNRAEAMPFDFPELLASLAPRALFTNAPLHDDFSVAGVQACYAVAAAAYQALGAADNLAVQHPDCRHDFPPTVREAAYAFIAGRL